MKINSTTLDLFRADFNEAVKQLESKFGVKVDLGKITYCEENFRATINVENKVTSTGISSAQHDWNEACGYFNLSKSDFGAIVALSNGVKVTIEGINTRSKKYPVQVRTSCGRSYKMTAESVIEQLNKHNLTRSVEVNEATKARIDAIDLSNVTVTYMIGTSKGLVQQHDDKQSRMQQVLHYKNLGLTSSSEIAKILGTNASYVNRLMK